MKSKYKHFFLTLGLLVVILSLFLLPKSKKPEEVKAQTQLAIANVTDNRGSYPGGQIPKYEKLEISFDIQNSVATNLLFPFDASPPPGVAPGQGISVTGHFTDPDGNTFQQPAFYYQEFDDQVKSNKEWFYPTANFSWKVRFTANKPGTWQYYITAQDAGGSTQGQPASFSVTASANNGFVKVSPDTRYFEFDDGTYFPGLGYNLNAGNLDIDNPVLGNTEEFTSMGQNGIQLSRVWISQKSIYGSAWGGWMSPNPAHEKNEHIMGLSHPLDAKLGSYQNLTPPSAIPDHEFYMWLNYDETVALDGFQYNFTPCRGLGANQPPIPLKPNTTYRLRVRYNAQALLPEDPNAPYGLTAKEGDLGSTANWINNPATRCYQPTQGQILAASFDNNDPWDNYPDPDYTDWQIMEREFTTGATQNFIDKHLVLALHNLKSPGPGQSGGHAFIDAVWLEEKLGTNSYGPNVIYKSNMGHHTYINERNAYALDKILDLAKVHNVYLKMVMLEKNDLIFSFIDPTTGELLPVKDGDNFYGNGKESQNGRSKNRWLQEAWWRYMQARWGYSPNVHSWELLNEGPPGPRDGLHWQMTDEFAKYLHCQAFGVAPQLVDKNGNQVLDCLFDHPNDHLATTSFWGSFPYFFWTDPARIYEDVDYADYHQYANESDPNFYDAAMFAVQSTANISASKPIVRGEVGWSFSGTDLFVQNASDGLWLHNFLWASLHPKTMMEQYFVGGLTFGRHIYCIESKCPDIHDHRPIFGTVYNFIKDIPLNDGNYQDVAAVVSDTNLRAWGQKDTVNNRAHLWIANKNHTWKNVYDNVNITPINGVITVGGFSASTPLAIEWWDTYSGTPTSTETLTTDGSGDLILSVSNLTTDTAVRIGDYTPQAILGDANGDSKVDGIDYVIWLNHYNQPTGNGAGDGDFNGDGVVDGVDYVMWLGNYNP